MLSVRAIKTSVFYSGIRIENFLVEALTGFELENRILAVTSKIVSLDEGRTVPRAKRLDGSFDDELKERLVRREADEYLGSAAYGCHLTIKSGLLIVSAGVDESNSSIGGFILYPEDPFQSANRIWLQLRKRFGLNAFGVILTDSTTTPLRRGVSGVGLAYAGFRPIRDLRGQSDLFGRPLQMTQVNLVDAWAAAAVAEMGEGGECRPIAILDVDADFVSSESSPDEVSIPIQDDIYSKMLKVLADS